MRVDRKGGLIMEENMPEVIEPIIRGPVGKGNDIQYHNLEDEYTLKVGEELTLTLKEQSIINMLWECPLPYGCRLVSKTYKYEGLLDIVDWKLVGLYPGVYRLKFEYRKQCCGKFLKEAKEVTITVNE